jgi:hypothetical protein
MFTNKRLKNLFHGAKGQIILLACVISIAILGDSSEYKLGVGINSLVLFFFISFSALYTAHIAKKETFSSKEMMTEVAVEYGVKTAGGLSAFYVLIHFDRDYRYYEHMAWVAIDSLLVAIPIAWFCSILFGKISTVKDD